jgi:transposase
MDMYLRPIWRKKKAYWVLLKSVRQGQKVRQEVVAYLGSLSSGGIARAQDLARRLGMKSNQTELFDPPLAEEVLPIRIKGIALERAREFGNVYLGMKLWQMAKFDEFFEAQMPKGQEDIPWATTAMISTIARLCDPSSELHIAEDWIRRTALCDMLLCDEAQINEDRLYRVLDKLLPCKDALQTHLKERWTNLFNATYDLVLYDVTSTYFEGQVLGNPDAQRGHSRDHRGDCKQVCLGLVVTPEGLPLAYDIFPGNTHDSKTVEQIVERMEASYGKTNRIWVWDRGMLSARILPWMREHGRRYVMALPKATLQKHIQYFEEDTTWQTVKNRDVEVRYITIPDPDSSDRFVLCRSAARVEKEKAMHTRFTTRIQQGLERLQGRLKKARKTIDLGKTQRQIGRLLQRNQRGATFFEIQCTSDAAHPSGIRLHWTYDHSPDHPARKMEGCYLLRTNIPDWSPQDVWSTYIQLVHVEEAFRIEKSQLEIRPVYHHKQDRVRAHIFVCFLAFVLWKILEQWQERAELGHSPRTILDEFAHIQSADIRLPIETGQWLRLRCVIKPEKHHQILLQRLGISLPQRMAMAPGIKM